MRMSINNLSFAYGGSTVLHDISLDVKDGEVVSIIGPNGSGKSTLMSCMANILKPLKGSVYLNGKDIMQINRTELACKIGYVPQAAKEEQPYTVLDTVLLGRKPYVKWGIGKRDIQLVGYILQQMGMIHLADRYLDELSGGQKQKVLVARALAQDPSVMLMDEPTSALDIRHQLEVLELVRDLAQQQRSVILVMHELNLAARYSDRLVLMKEGRIFATGCPEEVLSVENIRAVYGVDAKVTRSTTGLEIIPIQPHEPSRLFDGTLELEEAKTSELIKV